MTLEKGKEVSGGALVGALIALLALTGLSFGMSYVHLGDFSAVLAFSIAAVKVLIVAYIFMHLIEAVFATRLIGLVTALFIVIICLGIFADVGFR